MTKYSESIDLGIEENMDKLLRSMSGPERKNMFKCLRVFRIFILFTGVGLNLTLEKKKIKDDKHTIIVSVFCSKNKIICAYQMIFIKIALKTGLARYFRGMDL